MHDQRPVRKKCIVLISGLQSVVRSLWNYESTIFKQVVVNKLPEASNVSSPHSGWKRVNFWGECSRFKRWRSTLLRVSSSIIFPVPGNAPKEQGEGATYTPLMEFRLYGLRLCKIITQARCVKTKFDPRHAQNNRNRRISAVEIWCPQSLPSEETSCVVCPNI